MTRRLLPTEQVHTGIHDKLGGGYDSTLDEVISAISTYPVVIVGMKQNPFVKKARQLLQNKEVEFHYIEYGSYLSEWRKRLAIKMWSGFSTYPQVFVNGSLVGGYQDVKRLIDNGEWKALNSVPA
jgi:glutaredoxin-related protein